jgi:hypothetical protein
MDNAARVCVPERRCKIAQYAERLVQRKTRLLIHPFAQRASCNKRHRVERNAVRRARGEHRDDARMLKSGRQSDLAGKPLCGQFDADGRRQQLDDHLPAERVLSSDEDARHSAAAKFALDCVGLSERCLELLLEVSHNTCARVGGQRWAIPTGEDSEPVG